MSAVASQVDFAEALIDATSEAIMAVADDLVIRRANRAAANLFGMNAAGLPGMSFATLVPGVLGETGGVHGVREGGSLMGRIGDEYVQLNAKRGERFFVVELSVDPVTIDDEDLWVVVLRDMTELNASHRTLIRAHQELEEFNRLAVGREIRMIELKEEVNRLLSELDLPPAYEIVT